jgi:hypothetical protein
VVAELVADVAWSGCGDGDGVPRLGRLRGSEGKQLLTDAVEARRLPEFASTYIISLLEACIARCGRLAYNDQEDHFDPDSEAVSEVDRRAHHRPRLADV